MIAMNAKFRCTLYPCYPLSCFEFSLKMILSLTHSIATVKPNNPLLQYYLLRGAPHRPEMFTNSSRILFSARILAA